MLRISTLHRPFRAHRLTVLLLVSFLSFPLLAAAQATPPAGGHWEGAIQVPGHDLLVKIDLASAGGAWKGTIDIPEQGAKALPLEKVAVEGDHVQFAIAGVPGNPAFDGKLADGKIAGTFTQGGASIPFHLGREAAQAARRPQDPVPPFPYQEEEVAYQNGDIHLAGTLTLPPGAGPFPAVVLITGSGAQNRNEELLSATGRSWCSPTISPATASRCCGWTTAVSAARPAASAARRPPISRATSWPAWPS